MFGVKLAYLGVVIISGLFFIMYIDSLSLLLLGLVLILPIILFILGLIAKMSTSISVDMEPLVITKGSHSHIILQVENKSIISASRVHVYVSYKNNYDNKQKVDTIVFPASALSKQKIKMNISSAHCGTVSVEIQKATFYDFFRLWSFTKKFNKKYSVTVIPEEKMIEASINLNSNVALEADTFSKHKSGDDPSEVFKIRDYQGGDKLNRIHWKLSTKQDSLLVKEYSLPVDYSIVILLELAMPNMSKESLDYTDALVETVSCLSGFLIENETSHMICWSDGTQDTYCEREIASKEDLYEVIGLILQASLCANPVSSLTAFQRSGRTDKCSQVIYVTDNFSDDAVSIFDNPKYMFNKTIAYINKSEEDVSFSQQSRMNVISVSPENIEESLYRIVI